MGSSRIKSGRGRVIVRLRMCKGNLHPFCRNGADAIERARKLRRDARDADEPRRFPLEPRKQRGIRQAQMLRVLRAALTHAEKGAFHCDSAQSGSALRPYRMEPCRRAVRRFEPFLRQRQRSRAERGRAVRGKEARHAKEAFLRAVGKIRAAVAVQVNVHKSGQQHRARCAAAWPHCRNAAGIYLHIAGVKAEIRAKVKDAFKQHRRSPPLSCFGFSRNTHIQAR